MLVECTQVRQILPGSQFIYDLGTWNQGGDDLRGVDSVAVIGNVANGTDGLIPVPSASLSFATDAERTRLDRRYAMLADLEANGALGLLALHRAPPAQLGGFREPGPIGESLEQGDPRDGSDDPARGARVPPPSVQLPSRLRAHLRQERGARAGTAMPYQLPNS